jgi:hypothetical protein
LAYTASTIHEVLVPILSSEKMMDSVVVEPTAPPLAAPLAPR